MNDNEHKSTTNKSPAGPFDNLASGRGTNNSSSRQQRPLRNTDSDCKDSEPEEMVALEPAPPGGGEASKSSGGEETATEESDDDDDEDEDDDDDDYEEDEDEEYFNSDDLETGVSETQPEAATGSKVQQRQQAPKATAYQQPNTADGDGDEQRHNNNNNNGKRNSNNSSRNKQSNHKASKPTTPNPSTHYNTVNDSWFINYNGIIVILPIIFNAFQDKLLEQCYQRYSHGQRQKSLIMAHTIDLLSKLMLLYLSLFNLSHRLPVADVQNALMNTTLASTNQTTSNRTQQIQFSSSSDNDNEAFTGDKVATIQANNGGFLLIDSIIRDDLSSSSSTSSSSIISPNILISSHQEAMQLSNALMFGPLAKSIEPILVNTSENSGTGSEVDVGLLVKILDLNPWSLLFSDDQRILDFRNRILLNSFENYRLSTLFCAINLSIICLCICMPHKHLTNSLSCIALFTWFLMCLQNYLIYNNSESDKESALNLLPSKFAPLVSRIIHSSSTVTVQYVP